MSLNLPPAEEPPYKIVFFTEDEADEGPVWKWLQGLDDFQQRAALAALEQILSYRGLDVCKSEWGKALGEGLYELRIRRPARQILASTGHLSAEEEPDEGQKLLLRIFFHPYGQQMIVLLGGYDKLHRPSEREQQQQIDLARKRLKKWRQIN